MSTQYAAHVYNDKVLPLYTESHYMKKYGIYYFLVRARAGSKWLPEYNTNTSLAGNKDRKFTVPLKIVLSADDNEQGFDLLLLAATFQG